MCSRGTIHPKYIPKCARNQSQRHRDVPAVHRRSIIPWFPSSPSPSLFGPLSSSVGSCTSPSLSSLSEETRDTQARRTREGHAWTLFCAKAVMSCGVVEVSRLCSCVRMQRWQQNATSVPGSSNYASTTLTVLSM